MPVGTTIAGLCIAKNEADIIEAMVRHNLGFLDHLHVVDNDSADATPGILAALQEEFGGRLSWSVDARTGHGQQAINNEMLPGLAARTDAAQVVLLDADEFIRAERAAFRDRLFDSDMPVKMEWINYVPTVADNKAERNPIARITHRRRREVEKQGKITVPRGLIGRAQVGAGNHNLIAGGRVNFLADRALKLAHFPVRSREQLISKVLIGAWNLRLRGTELKKEAGHWRAMAARILAGDAISEADVQGVALTYGVDVAVRTVEDPLSAPGDMKLLYTPDNAALLERNLIAFAESCVRRLESASLG
jgi:hypothetical protein